MESDYIEFPERVVLSKAMRSTNIRYNLVEASAQGIKDKNNQFLSKNHTGTEMSWSEYGNKIHHNIIKNPRNRPVMMESDFVQIYNNIMDLSNQGYTSSRRADLHHWDDGERVYFHNCFYNNTLIRTRVETEHFYDSTSVNSTHNTSFKPSLSDPINPYHYFYNNIFYDVGNAVNGRLDLNIIWNYGAYDVDTGIIDMSTIFVERNLFIPRLPSTKVIVVGASSDTFSITDYFNRGWATKNYAQSSTSGLFSTSYKTNGSFSLGGSDTISNGGVGGNHPYLSNVKIPSYVGATDPNNDGWVDNVLNLSKLNNLKLYSSASTPPPSVSTASSTVETLLPPPPTKLIVIE